MITQIDLRFFKCFEVLKLPLCALTLLSGQNASGKSAVIQALVLLHQTIRDNEWARHLILNGSILSLGTASDLIDCVYGREEFSIGLTHNNQSFLWSFRGSRDDDMKMHIQDVSIDGNRSTVVDGYRCLLPIASGPFSITSVLQNMAYLQAERSGPKEMYALAGRNGSQLSDQAVGTRGENAVSVLYSNKDVRITNLRVDNSDIPPTLFAQVEARMEQFFPGFQLEVEKISKVNAATLGIKTSSATDYHRPVHTGFGLTQALPIIVAILISKPNDLIIIENPEVHMHPAGQAKIGQFLAKAAASGIQIIIESHSDHILSGIRRAVKEKALSSDDVAIHFFRKRSEDSKQRASQVQSPIIDSNGNIDSWPRGFFDQFDVDMDYFAGWG